MFDDATLARIIPIIQGMWSEWFNGENFTDQISGDVNIMHNRLVKNDNMPYMPLLIALFEYCEEDEEDEEENLQRVDYINAAKYLIHCLHSNKDYMKAVLKIHGRNDILTVAAYIAKFDPQYFETLMHGFSKASCLEILNCVDETYTSVLHDMLFEGEAWLGAITLFIQYEANINYITGTHEDAIREANADASAKVRRNYSPVFKTTLHQASETCQDAIPAIVMAGFSQWYARDVDGNSVCQKLQNVIFDLEAQKVTKKFPALYNFVSELTQKLTIHAGDQDDNDFSIALVDTTTALEYNTFIATAFLGNVRIIGGSDSGLALDHESLE